MAHTVSSFWNSKKINFYREIILILYIKEEYSLSKIYLTLKEKLEECGLTRYKHSKMTGIQYQTIDKYYKNKVVKYDSFLLERFCTALNCPVSDLVRMRYNEE